MLAPARPPCMATQASDLAWERLNTLISWPAAARCPAIGPPMTPNPIKLTFMRLIFLPTAGDAIPLALA